MCRDLFWDINSISLCFHGKGLKFASEIVFNYNLWIRKLEDNRQFVPKVFPFRRSEKE